MDKMTSWIWVKVLLITIGAILLRLAILGATVAFIVWVAVTVCNALGGLF